MDRYERKVILIMVVVLTATVLTIFLTSGLDFKASAVNESILSNLQREAVCR